MGKFRKKPVEIEARQFRLRDPEGILEWIVDKSGQGKVHVNAEGDIDALMIWTLEGEMIANLGDWVIRGIAGEFYPCKPDIFAATYEAVPA